MKRLARCGAALLVLLGMDGMAALAAEASVIRIAQPPREFRSGPSVHGPVSVVYEQSMARIKTEFCPSLRASVGLVLGCANIGTGRGCAITLWAGLRRAPALRAAIEAHERAHCRGWGPGHPGGIVRSYSVGRSFMAAARAAQNLQTADR